MIFMCFAFLGTFWPITFSSLLLYFTVHSFKRNLLLCLWSLISLSRTIGGTKRKTAHDGMEYIMYNSVYLHGDPYYSLPKRIRVP